MEPTEAALAGFIGSICILSVIGIMIVPLLLMDLCNCAKTCRNFKRNIKDGGIRCQNCRNKCKSKHSPKNNKTDKPEKENSKLIEKDKSKEQGKDNSKLTDKEKSKEQGKDNSKLTDKEKSKGQGKDNNKLKKGKSDTKENIVITENVKKNKKKTVKTIELSFGGSTA